MSRVSPAVTYRGADGDRDPLYEVPIRRFRSLDDLRFEMDEPARYSVRDHRFTLPIDVLFYPRRHSRLLVGFHGAEDRRTMNAPKFQFVRSFLTRDESLLFVADSTVLQSEAINIGWLAGNAETPLASLVSEIVRIATANASATEVVLAGHSAGGYSAILVGSQVPNSRAVSINGQTVIKHYEPWTIRNLHSAAFPECEDPDDMLEAYAQRLDLRVALRSRCPAASFTMFGNRIDQATFGRLPHFPLLADYLGVDPLMGGTAQTGDAMVAADWTSDPTGHALPGTILPFLQMVLGEAHNLDISLSSDPRWRPSS